MRAIYTVFRIAATVIDRIYVKLGDVFREKRIQNSKNKNVKLIRPRAALTKPLQVVLLVSLIAVGLGGFALLASNSSILNSPAQEQMQHQVQQQQQIAQAEQKFIGHVTSPDEALNAGLIRSAIWIEPEQFRINATRGSTVSVVLKITHKPGPDPLPSVTVNAIGATGITYPPSLAKSVSNDQAKEALVSGKLIPGSIRMNDLVRFDPTSITLAPGETKTIQLFITLPQNLPDEWVNKSIPISPIYKSPEQSTRGEVGIFHNGVTVRVVG